MTEADLSVEKRETNLSKKEPVCVCVRIYNCCTCTSWQYLYDFANRLLSHTWTCCFCVLSMLGSMLSGPSTLIISSFSLSHGPSWLAAEAKLPSLSAHVSSSVCLWAAVWLAVCQRESGEITSWDRNGRTYNNIICKMLMNVFYIHTHTSFLLGESAFFIKL